MPRPFLIALVVFSSALLLSGCASTTTAVGVTTNEAPRLNEIGR